MPSIFSKIIAKEIPARIVYEDDLCVAFHDANPQAPTHILVIPKKEIPRLAAAGTDDKALLGHLLFTAREVARKEGIGESGFRIVINSGPHGGETVPHLHVHVLGGRHMEWPPG
jgi:histidine triad (HIT) family protein